MREKSKPLVFEAPQREKEAEDTRGRLSNRLQASPSVQKKTNNKKKKRWRVRINSIWSYSVYISMRERETRVV